VTSVSPLTIYLYDEGLVRFASKSYSTASRWRSISDVGRERLIGRANNMSGSKCREVFVWTAHNLFFYQLINETSSLSTKEVNVSDNVVIL